MLEIFKRYIKMKQPTFIQEFEQFSSDGVTCVYCKFLKDGKYYCATSYMTDAWISPNPIGGTQDYCMMPQELESVADVREFADFGSCYAFVPMTASRLHKFLETVTEQGKELYSFLPLEQGDTLDVALKVSPIPMVLLTLRHSGVIGTIAVTSGGTALLVSSFSPRIKKYVQLINSQFGKEDLGTLAIAEISRAGYTMEPAVSGSCKEVREAAVVPVTFEENSGVTVDEGGEGND